MGRIPTLAGRVWCTLGLLVVLPLAGAVDRTFVAADGTHTMAITAGLVVAYMLSVGPLGSPAAVVALLADGRIGGAGWFEALWPAVLFAGLAALMTVVLERRFARHGPVRTSWVVLEFGLAAALALPALALGLRVLAHEALGWAPVPGDPMIAAVSQGVGILTTAVGIRMLLHGQHRQLAPGARVWLVAAVLVSSVVTVGVATTAGAGALQQSHLVVAPVLTLGLLAGTVAYALGMLGVTVLVSLLLAAMADTPALEVTLGSQSGWWVVLLLGLLLGTEGDRRRAQTRAYRSLFDTSATATARVLPGAGRVTRANQALTELTGWSAERLRTTSLAELVVGDQELVEQLARLLAGEAEEISVEGSLRRDDGTTRYVRCIGRVVGLGGPQADLVQLQLVDLTAERDREAALRRSNDALARFGRRASHDLKQPLVAMAGYAATLRAHARELDEDVVDQMHERLEHAARRASTQLDDMLRGAAASRSTRVALAGVVESAIGLLAIDLQAAGADVGVDLAVTEVTSDAMMVRQVLLNLLTNSCKYARPGVPLRIRVSSRQVDGGTAIRVVDNGIGIPSDALEVVFEPGLRLAPGAADGRGLGLGDSRALAEEHGGRLLAEPRQEGASVVLWLPDLPGAGTAVTVEGGSEQAVVGATESRPAMARERGVGSYGRG